MLLMSDVILDNLYLQLMWYKTAKTRDTSNTVAVSVLQTMNLCQ